MALLLVCCCALIAGQEKPQDPKDPKNPPPPKKEKFAVPKQPALTSRLTLISISGLGSEQLRKLVGKKAEIAAKLSHLRQLFDNGATASITESIYPSLPLSARATILTGMLPVDHGIFESGLGEEELKIETILDQARRAGLKARAIEAPTDDERANAAIRTIREREADLIFVEFTNYATAVAKSGLDARGAIAALENIDECIGKIMSAGGEEMTLIVVSDGGRLNVEREFRPNVILERKGFLTVDKEGNITSWRVRSQALGGAAMIITKDQPNEKLLLEIREAFKEVVKSSESPLWSVTTQREASSLGADPRAVLFLDAAPLYVISDRANGGSTGGASVRAAAGYLPSRSEMRAVFLASGRGIRPGTKIEYARLIDVAPTIARLLGLEMRMARGRVITEFLSQ